MSLPLRTVALQVPRRLARRRRAVRAHVRGLAGPVPTSLPVRDIPARAGIAAPASRSVGAAPTTR